MLVSLPEEVAEETAGREHRLAILRSIRAWPPPHLSKFRLTLHGRAGQISMDDSQALDLPPDAYFTGDMRLVEHFREQQHKVEAFVGGLHRRLGSVSAVSLLKEQMVILIADEVMGRSAIVSLSGEGMV